MNGVGLDDASDETEDEGGLDEGRDGPGRARGEGGAGGGTRVIDSCSSPLVVDVL